MVTAEPAGSAADDPALAESKSRLPEPSDPFAAQLRRAARAFIARRGSGKTIIAGYPWFLDWGRDTLICARGLLAAGMTADVEEILLTFARFEKDGTLPNTIHGDNTSNRDTSDAPLWFGIACEELARMSADAGGRPSRKGPRKRSRPPPAFTTRRPIHPAASIRDVLRSIATHYAAGTPNGIRMDPESGLIWSPSHFTWMDTNYPAGTPREGLSSRNPGAVDPAAAPGRRHRRTGATGLLEPTRGPGAGVGREALLAGGTRLVRGPAGGGRGSAGRNRPGQRRAPQQRAVPASLGLARGDRAKRTVEAARHYLVVPGALRSLAPRPVSFPLPILGNDGRLRLLISGAVGGQPVGWKLWDSSMTTRSEVLQLRAWPGRVRWSCRYRGKDLCDEAHRTGSGLHQRG